MVNDTFEIIKDETGKLTDVKVNGKSVKRGSVAGMRKAMETPQWAYFSTIDPRGVFVAQNPFSGVEVSLNALEYQIYKWCVNWYINYERGKLITPIQTYDRVKYFLLEINPSAYMDLLD